MYRCFRSAFLPLVNFVLRYRGWTPLVVLAYGPLLLFLDAHTTAAWPGQYLLGVVTLAVLWLCVIVATGFEMIGSLVWGAYRYRFGGIPLFVPFGHGVIYVFAAALAATPARHVGGAGRGRGDGWLPARAVATLDDDRCEPLRGLCWIPAYQWCKSRFEVDRRRRFNFFKTTSWTCGSLLRKTLEEDENGGHGRDRRDGGTQLRGPGRGAGVAGQGVRV